MDLKGRVAIITGASRGIGKAIAIGFGRAGASVVVAARTEHENERLKGTIHETALEIERSGGSALAVKCDVTKEGDVVGMVERAYEKFGRIDILINNAGIAAPLSILDMTLKHWELVLKVNLTGPFLCVKYVLPVMIGHGGGSIINISSIQAQSKGSVSTGVVYGVSKAGLERLTTGLAMELERFKIRVNCVKPKGAVITEGMMLLNPDADISKWSTPDMMVKACLFLASEKGKGISGMVATDEEICVRYNL
ncbi:MAG: SDR family NAD(P)-dependent oxidoreductase [Syntrophorhabdaceae bacterium]|nr:SDR family NAD(P)-dependent oxidoreductase [Syntrophorhabdaceae bacterium]